MQGTSLFLLGLIVVPALCQMMVFWIVWRRLSLRLQAQEPRTTALEIHSFGDNPPALARPLARHTRLDLAEIDDLIEVRRTGRLPLLLSWRKAQLLSTELRALGAEVETRG